MKNLCTLSHVLVEYLFWRKHFGLYSLYQVKYIATLNLSNKYQHNAQEFFYIVFCFYFFYSFRLHEFLEKLIWHFRPLNKFHKQ